MHTIPNSIGGVGPEDFEGIFREQIERLGFSEESGEWGFCFDVFARVQSGANYLSHGNLSFTDWWTQIQVGEVSFVDTDKSPLNILVRKYFPHTYRQILAGFSHQTAVDCGFVPQDIESEEEKRILTLFWNGILEMLQSQPTAK